MNDGIFSWLKRNSWNVLGTVIGIGGLISGYWFYRASLQIPSLSFADSQPHAVVINYGAMSDAPVRLIRRDDTAVAQNVFSTNVYVWNSGNVSLRRSSILKPLAITLSNGEILDAKLIKVTRDVTQIVVGTVEEGKNRLPLSFDILEPNDGLALSVLYTNAKVAELNLDGIIEGVRTFSPVEIRPSDEVALKTAWSVVKKVGVLALTGALIFGIGATAGLIRRRIPERYYRLIPERYYEIIEIAIKGCWALVFIGGILYALIKYAHKEVIGTPENQVPASITRN